VAEWSAGGLTCREYAVRKGVSPSTLAWWKWKLASEGERLDDPVPPMEVTALVASAGAERGTVKRCVNVDQAATSAVELGTTGFPSTNCLPA
jgi:hypothetical protein